MCGSFIHSFPVAAGGSPFWLVTHVGINHVTCEHLLQVQLNQDVKKSLDCLPNETISELKCWLLTVERCVDRFPCSSRRSHGKRNSKRRGFPWKRCRHTPKGGWRFIYSRPRPFLAPRISRRRGNHFCLLLCGDLCAH